MAIIPRWHGSDYTKPVERCDENLLPCPFLGIGWNGGADAQGEDGSGVVAGCQVGTISFFAISLPPFSPQTSISRSEETIVEQEAYGRLRRFESSFPSKSSHPHWIQLALC